MAVRTSAGEVWKIILRELLSIRFSLAHPLQPCHVPYVAEWASWVNGNRPCRQTFSKSQRHGSRRSLQPQVSLALLLIVRQQRLNILAAVWADHPLFLNLGTDEAVEQTHSSKVDTTVLVIGKVHTFSPPWLMMNPMLLMCLKRKPKNMTRFAFSFTYNGQY